MLLHGPRAVHGLVHVATEVQELVNCAVKPVQQTTSRIGNFTRLMHTPLLHVITIHTYIDYIHTYHHSCPVEISWMWWWDAVVSNQAILDGWARAALLDHRIINTVNAFAKDKAGFKFLGEKATVFGKPPDYWMMCRVCTCNCFREVDKTLPRQ